MIQASQLLEKVEEFEASYDKFSGRLKEKRGALDSFKPLAITIEDIKEQIQEVEVSFY